MNIWSFSFADPSHPWVSARVAASDREKAHFTVSLAIMSYAMKRNLSVEHDPQNSMIVVSHIGVSKEIVEPEVILYIERRPQ